MTRLAPLRLDDNTVIYIETTEALEMPLPETAAEDEEEEIPIRKGMTPERMRQQMVQNFRVIQSTIRAYTLYSLNAFRQVAIANVDKVTLEFGIEVGGEVGVPYVTKGTAKSNLKVTVECSFPQDTESTSPSSHP